MTHSSKAQPVFAYMLEGAKPWGTRLFPDGRVEVFSDEEVEFVQGEFRTKRVTPAWRPRVMLPATDVASLKARILALGFMDLPATFAGRPARDGRTIVWSATVHGRSHAVTTRDQAQVEQTVLERLRVEFEDMVASALNRDDSEAQGTRDGSDAV